MSRTIVLTERRAIVRRLPRADVDDLVRDFSPVVEVTPTLERGYYRVRPRGYVGWFHTTTTAWEIRPKLEWDALHWLSRAPDDLSASRADWTGFLADLLAARLADLMRERAESGLLRDYAERAQEESTIRGRIDFPRQFRSPPQSARFHLITDEFTPDVTWNQAPKAAARQLLTLPLSREVRGRLVAAIAAFSAVTDNDLTATQLDRLVFTPRTEAYRPLIGFSRLVLDRRTAPRASGPGASSFLVNLEQLFQQSLSEQLAAAGVFPAGWRVEPEPSLDLDPEPLGWPGVRLRPDLLIRQPDGEPRAVWDVKWKKLGRGGPDPADLHQVLGYAAALGVGAAGLIYPGKRTSTAVYRTARSSVTLRVVRLRVVGTRPEKQRALRRLARLMRSAG